MGSILDRKIELLHLFPKCRQDLGVDESRLHPKNCHCMFRFSLAYIFPLDFLEKNWDLELGSELGLWEMT